MPSEIVNDIKTVLDITSRMDERVKIIQSGQSETHNQLNKLAGDLVDLAERVTVIESRNGHKTETLEEKVEIAKDRLNLFELRIIRLEDHKQNWLTTVKQYSGLVIQGVWVIVVCYLLYKLGINTPPLP